MYIFLFALISSYTSLVLHICAKCPPLISYLLLCVGNRISHENPLVQAALKEVATHPVLRPLLDAALGPSSSLVSMSAITNVHGAAEQHFHADTHTSAATHPEYFVPEFQLGIPLQNTTAEMGATEVCPGTHRCRCVCSNGDVVLFVLLPPDLNAISEPCHLPARSLQNAAD